MRTVKALSNLSAVHIPTSPAENGPEDTEVEEQVETQAEQVEKQMEVQVKEQVEALVTEQVEKQVTEQVETQAEEQVKTQADGSLTTNMDVDNSMEEPEGTQKTLESADTTKSALINSPVEHHSEHKTEPTTSSEHNDSHKQHPPNSGDNDVMFENPIVSGNVQKVVTGDRMSEADSTRSKTSNDGI